MLFVCIVRQKKIAVLKIQNSDWTWSDVMSVRIDVFEPDERPLDFDRRTSRDTAESVDELALKRKKGFGSDLFLPRVETDGLDLECDRVCRQRPKGIRLRDEVDVVDTELHLVGACQCRNPFANIRCEAGERYEIQLELHDARLEEHGNFWHFLLRFCKKLIPINYSTFS